jgi:hypothetical protein
LCLDIGNERIGDVRQDDARQHVDPIGLDQLARARERGRGHAFIVLQNHRELAAGDLPPALLPVKLASAVHVLARLSDGSGERRQETDLDGRLRPCLPGEAERRKDGGK